MSVIKTISITFVLLYSLILLLIYLLQYKLIYFPDNTIVATPKDLALSFEEIDFLSDDVLLNGWYIPAKNERAVLLFCHGNAGNISHRLESIKIFHKLNLSVFIFDYRGYGKSKGTPSEMGTYTDTQFAYNYLVKVKGVDPDKIILFGRSLGGAMAIHQATVSKANILIVESAFTSVPDVAQKLYPIFPVRWLSRIKYPNLKNIEKVNIPVLIIHSKNDDVIPFHHGEMLFERANSPKEFFALKGKHNDGFLITQNYVQTVEMFISKWLNK